MSFMMPSVFIWCTDRIHFKKPKTSVPLASCRVILEAVSVHMQQRRSELLHLWVSGNRLEYHDVSRYDNLKCKCVIRLLVCLCACVLRADAVFTGDQ